MLIGFDGKRAFNNYTGLGNYSRLLVSLLADRLPDDRMLLYAPKRRDNPRMASILRKPNVDVMLPDTAMGRSFSSLWRVRGVTSQIERDGVTLFHGLSNELPLNIRRARIPTVVTIHDLIFRHFPECYKPIDRKIYDYKFRHAAHAATRVIAISLSTRRDLMEMYGVDPDKIDVIYQGCDPQFARPVDADQIALVKRKYGLQRPYIIGVGTIEQRKNQMLTVMALKALPTDVGAVIVGRRTPYARRIDEFVAANGLKDRVKIIDAADFTDFPALYAGALLSSYPSRFEGFGIPVIESLSCGTPVIVAAGSCLEEAAGPDAPVVGPDDLDAFVDHAREIISSPSVRERYVEAGRRNIAKFNHENFVDGVLRTYTKAINSM